MAEATNIEWADATLNFWVGCTKVSVGEKGACTHCYAETWANRWPQNRGTWGVGAPRIQFSHLQAKARKLEKLAIAKAARGEGAFFCFSNSLSDIFDNEVPIAWLAEAIEIARSTPHVTYLFLTKRPQNIVKRFLETIRVTPPPGMTGIEAIQEQGLDRWWPRNIAIGCTVVTQKEADRDIPWLLKAKALLRPAFAFVSMEPLMEVVDLTQIEAKVGKGTDVFSALSYDGDPDEDVEFGTACIDWVITGGESGTNARITPVEAFRSLRDQCAQAGVPFMFKQWGEWVGAEVYEEGGHGGLTRSQVPGETFPGKPAHWWSGDALGGVISILVGKKAAGRLLDGVEHNDRPVPRQLEAA